jgi:branched-chain amino acid transport system permease protein
VVVLVVAPLLVVPFGLLTAWPAIRRRGLFLALTTFAVGATLSRFVFEQPTFVTGVHVQRPSAFGPDGSFYVLEVVCLTVGLLLVWNLHRGRLGRALVAVRDDEAGARASGVDVRRLKVLVFGAASGLAGLGGTLLAMGNSAFDSSAFDPLQSLVWFAAVVVFGIDSALGALLGAALLVTLDTAFPAGTSTIALGVGALLIGRMPGGAVHHVHRLFDGIGARFATRRAPEEARQLSPAGVALARRLPGRIP